MITNPFINNNIEQIEPKEPGLGYFKDQIRGAEHVYRQNKVHQILNHLHRHHKVLNREKNVFMFKNKAFVPSAILLQGIKTVINFHVAYLVGNPVTLTGEVPVVEMYNNIYRKGIYSKTDWQVLNDIVTFGNAFEYVYYDPVMNIIKSKVFRNADSYPIYDENGDYRYFVEYWKDKNKRLEHYNIYFPDHVDSYVNNTLTDSKPNITGLPIHYSCMERAEYDQYGDSMVLDLIPIMDRMEHLLSKEDDAITTLSLNPILTVQGQKVTESDMVNTNVAGVVLRLEEANQAEYVTAKMDYSCIKHEFDSLYQQFNMIAGIPSSILGQSNIANVSESTTSIIYQLTENRGKQNINALIDGFRQRWECMRKLSDPISDDDFYSLNVSFNMAKPTDTKNIMENMEMQYNMGAISRRTVMEQSPYTTDSAQEIQRLIEEGNPIDKPMDDGKKQEEESELSTIS